jgi:hypothetical protein
VTQKQNIRLLLLAGLTAVSIGGLLIHLKIHRPGAAEMNLIPFIAGLISLLVVPTMFFVKKTRQYAYVVNGMLVIIGTITMFHFSLMSLPAQITLSTILFGTLLGSIITLWANFAIGKALFELEMFKAIDASIRQGRYWRYPNMGWWGVHVAALSAVYVVGNVLWR